MPFQNIRFQGEMISVKILGFCQDFNIQEILKKNLNEI